MNPRTAIERRCTKRVNEIYGDGAPDNRKTRGIHSHFSATLAPSPATHRTAVNSTTYQRRALPVAERSGEDWRARGRRQAGAGVRKVDNLLCRNTSGRAGYGLRCYGRWRRRQNIVIVCRAIQAGHAIVGMLAYAVFDCMQGDAQLSNHQHGDNEIPAIDDSANHWARLSP